MITLPIERLDVLDDGTARSAAMNMAVDEALLESITAPLLRFYRWKRPSLSFGYFGRFQDIADEIDRRDVVRRWTGGGIVLHGTDVTYSMIVPKSDPLAARAPRELYFLIHDAIRRALSRDVSAALAAHNAVKVSDACFANPVVADVLVGGRKIAGAAQRRTRAGLLHQGSIQYGPVPGSFTRDFANALCDHFEPASRSPAVLERAEVIANQKYGSETWLRRR